MKSDNKNSVPIAITIIGELKGIIKKRYKQNKKVTLWVSVILLLVPIITSSAFSQIVRDGYISIFRLLTSWFNIEGIVVALLILYFEFFLVVKFLKTTNTELIKDEERNYEISEQGHYGTNRFMNEKDIEEIFKRGPLKEIKGDFLGLDDNGLFYQVRDDVYGLNKNMCFVGGPGCGKSRALVYNMLLQIMRRGESFIAADTKGSVYTEMAYIAMSMGYIVKIFNVKPDEMMSSDGCDFMATIQGDVLRAQSFANTIIKNTTDGVNGKDFWSDSEYNLLTAGILYVSYAPEYDGKRNLASVHELFVKNSVATLEDKLSYIINNKLHPATDPFSIYKNADKTVKGNTLAGLGIRLKIFNDQTVKKITTEDEIDLALPGFKKCAYFVVTDDTDDSMKVLSSLFYSCLYSEITRAADFQKDKKVPIPVNILLDEFKNGGIIPSFDKKIATVRSRGVSTTIILQDIPQLMGMYPEDVWKSVLGCFDIQILLKTNEKDTATHFMERTGEQTINVRNIRYKDYVTDIMRVKDDTQVTHGLGTRNVMTLGEIYTLHPAKILVIISQRQPILLNKFDFSKHPMSKKIKQLQAIDHMPVWRKRELEAGNKYFFVKKENPYEKYRTMYEEEQIKEGTSKNSPPTEKAETSNVEKATEQNITSSFMKGILEQDMLHEIDAPKEEVKKTVSRGDAVGVERKVESISLDITEYQKQMPLPSEPVEMKLTQVTTVPALKMQEVKPLSDKIPSAKPKGKTYRAVIED